MKHLVSDTDRHGNVRHYVRIKGRRKVRIRHPLDSPDFLASYHRVVGGAEALPPAPQPTETPPDEISNKAFVYVISPGKIASKIGFAKDPEKRLAALQSGSPMPLRLYYLFEVAAHRAMRLERGAHTVLKLRKQVGEWFDVSPEDAAEAIGIAAGRLGIATREMAFPGNKTG